MRALILPFALIIPAMPLPAAAEDAQSDALTVLPWTSGSLVASSKETRGVVQVSHALPASWRVNGSLSAPLDEDERIAAFATNTALAPGIKLTGQLGWDSDSEVLAETERWLKELRAVQIPLAKIPEYAARGEVAAFHAAGENSSGGAHGDAAVLEHFKTACPACTDLARLRQNVEPSPRPVECQVGVKQVQATRAADQEDLAKVLAARDAAQRAQTEGPGARATAEQARTAAESARAAAQKDRDGMYAAARSVLASCFAKEWFETQLERQRAYEELLRVLKRAPKDLVLSPELEEQVKGLSPVGKLQLVGDKLGAAIAFIEKARREAAGARRDLLLVTRAKRKHAGQAVLLDVSASFDSQSVYQDDLMGSQVSTSIYDLTLGLNYSYLPTVTGLSASARIGLEQARGSGADEVERCTAADPGSAAGGEKCEKVLFRAGAQPDAETTGYARLAIDYQWQDEDQGSETIPGVELRAAMEGIGGTRQGHLRLSLFATPIKGDVAGRLGLAIDASYAIDRASTESGTRWTFTPMVFLGVTLADFLGMP